MKILKSILILFLFSNFITSCIPENLVEELETTAVENIQATGEDDDGVDETEKDD